MFDDRRVALAEWKVVKKRIAQIGKEKDEAITDVGVIDSMKRAATKNSMAQEIKAGQTDVIKAEKRTVNGEEVTFTRYYDMIWYTERFARVDFDPCWQQHERARRVSDWLVAYQSCMGVCSMQEYVTATPITVSQFANLVFFERPVLAQLFYNDVLRGLSGHYSLDPKWLAKVTLGYVGTTELKQQDNSIRATTKCSGKVQLIMLADVLYSRKKVAPSETNQLISDVYGIFMNLVKNDVPKQKFYSGIKPIVAFEVEDSQTQRSFYYVTNAEMCPDEDYLIRLRKTSSKPDIVSTQVNQRLRGNREIKTMRELSRALDSEDVELLKDNQYVEWGKPLTSKKAPPKDGSKKKLSAEEQELAKIRAQMMEKVRERDPNDPLMHIYQDIADYYDPGEFLDKNYDISTGLSRH
jgi:hypothetical protein